MNGLDDLASAQRRFERADDEVLHRDRARTRQASQRQFRTQRRQRGYPVCRGIGMAERSADRAAIAHGAIGDVGGDALHGAARDVRNASVLDVGMGDAGAEHEFVAATLDLLQFGKTGDVDDQLAAPPAAD